MENTRMRTNPKGGFSIARKATARPIFNFLQHSPTQFREIVKEKKVNFNRNGQKKIKSPFPGENLSQRKPYNIFQ